MRPSPSLVVLLCCLAAGCDGSRPTRVEHEIPDVPDGYLRFVDIAAGRHSACGLTADSLVYCWGSGHLTDERDYTRPVRIDVPPLGSIAVGLHHDYRLRDMLCATTASEDVICRGAAAGGVVTVPGATGWRSLTVGGAICALAAGDDGARCWSYTPLFGVLGTANTDGVPVGTPVEVDGGRAYGGIFAGSSTACAIEWGYETWCWGYNHSLQAGDASTGDIVVTPVRLPFATGFVEMSVGDSHSCAALISGRTFCWGLALHDQLGSSDVSTVDCPAVYDASTNAPAPCSATAVEVEGNHSFVHVAAGGTHTCASDGSGLMYCWGTGTWGQLGNGESGPANRFATPQPVVGGLTVRRLVAGEHFTCAIASNDATYCWGSNQRGQLGIGADFGFVATVPHPVAAPAGP